MLNLQNTFNENLNKDWLNADWKWDYALMQEYSEAFAYIPWKWWKHETIDKNQLIMELVDIFHFGMSHDISKYHINTSEPLIDIIDSISDNYSLAFNNSFHPSYDEYHNNNGSLSFEDWQNDFIKQSIKYSINDITLELDPFFNIDEFVNIWSILGLTIDDLYKKYIGKNVLNIFRQNHGYKSGEYIKIWNGLEDNEHLTNIIHSLNCDEHLYHNVYSQLEELYNSL